MKYFRKLIIENFQSHGYTEIDFVPGLNVFVGPSDSGKSSILRALRWVLFNQPRGTDFIRKGAKKCQVRLVLDDGTEIIRVRGKSENCYLLRTPDGKEERYESIGQGSHQMILQAHQMMPLTWDQKETLLQFASQLEGPFLLSESSGSKAKLIGRISGAHWIDLALKEATREKNQILSEIRQVERQKEAIEKKLQPYDDVPEWEKAVKKATNVYQHVQQMKQKGERLTWLAEQLQANRREQKKQKDWLAQFQHLPELEKRQWNVEQEIFLLRQLNQFAQKRKRVQSEKLECQAFLQQTQELTAAEKAYQHLGEQIVKLKRLTTIFERWKQVRTATTRINQQLDGLKSIPALMEAYEACISKIEQYQRLQKHYQSWTLIQQEKGRVHQVVSSTEEGVRWLNERYPELERQLERYQRLIEIKEKYQETRKSLRVGRDYLQQRIQEIEENMKEYMELLKQFGRCPTCGSSIDALLLERLEQELYGGEKYAAVGRTDESHETKVGES